VTIIALDVHASDRARFLFRSRRDYECLKPRAVRSMQWACAVPRQSYRYRWVPASPEIAMSAISEIAK
jgi:hypothetical protein